MVVEIGSTLHKCCEQFQIRKGRFCGSRLLKRKRESGRYRDAENGNERFAARERIQPRSNKYSVGYLRSVSGCERGCVLVPFRLRGDHLHLLPVVGKFSSAVQASHVGAGQCAGLRASRRTTNGHWEAIPGVPAAKQQINQSCQHLKYFCEHLEHLPHPGWFSLGSYECAVPLCFSNTLNTLDSFCREMVSFFLAAGTMHRRAYCK